MKKSTLVVVAVAVALAAFVYFYDSKHSSSASSADLASKPAFSVPGDTVTHLTIENKNGKFVLAKAGNTWNITEPVQARGDQGTIGGVADDVSGARISRSFPSAGDLAQYGLDHPAVTVQFQGKGGAKHTIRLGGKDFSNSNIYGQIDNSKDVAVLPVSLLDETDQPLLHYRDKSIFDLNGAEITGLKLTGAAGHIEFSKEASGWEITKPKNTPADADSLNALINSLSSTQFSSVASETATDLKKYGLAHPELTLDAISKKGKEFKLLIGKEKSGSYYARDDSRPLIFTLSSNFYNTLSKKFADWRDKSILHFEAADLSSVVVKNSKGIVECAEGKDDQWTMTSPASDKGKAVQSWKFIDPLQNTRATKIYDTPPASAKAALAKPAIEVTLKDKSGKTTRVRISPAGKDSAYVGTSNGPEVYQVPKQILTDLGFSASDLIS